MRQILVMAIFVIVAFVAHAHAQKQCSEGGCCDVPTGKFKVAGTVCEESKHECLEANSVCDGFNAKCNRKTKTDGTKCNGGACKAGVCVQDKINPIKSEKKTEVPKKEEKKTEVPKKEEKKNEEKKEDKKPVEVIVVRESTKDMEPKQAVKSLLQIAMENAQEQQLLEQLRAEEKADTERAANYFINQKLKRTISKIIENNSPTKRMNTKLSSPPSKEAQKLDDLLMKDPRNRMKFFGGLQRELLKANRIKFNKRIERKVPMSEKYADYIRQEHQVVNRHMRKLEQVGYYQDKYFDANLLNPVIVVNTTQPTKSSSSLMATIFTGKTGGVNLFAVIIAGVAVLAVVIIVIALVSRKGKDTKSKKPKEEFEKF